MALRGQDFPLDCVSFGLFDHAAAAMGVEVRWTQLMLLEKVRVRNQHADLRHGTVCRILSTRLSLGHVIWKKLTNYPGYSRLIAAKQ